MRRMLYNMPLGRISCFPTWGFYFIYIYIYIDWVHKLMNWAANIKSKYLLFMISLFDYRWNYCRIIKQEPLNLPVFFFVHSSFKIVVVILNHIWNMFSQARSIRVALFVGRKEIFN